VKGRFLYNTGRITMVILAMFIFGCAAAPPKLTPDKGPETVPASGFPKGPEKVPVSGFPKGSEKDPFLGFPERYRQQAIEYEKNNDLPKALQCWEIVKAFQPINEEAIQKTTALRVQIKILADQHFKKGLSYYQNRSIPEARKEFLLTLYHDPDHTESLSYLKNKLIEAGYISYEVMPGDTLREIAKKIYNDPQKDVLIAYFNDLEKDPKLTPKTTLRLPVLDVPQIQPAPQPAEIPMDPKEILDEPKEAPIEAKETKEEKMAKAVAYFKANKFKETASIAGEILLSDPSNKEARDLTNASHYQMGKALHQEKKYRETLEQLGLVDPKYRDVREWIISVKRQLAEVYYINGIKYYTQEKLDQAIQEWRETLKLNPQHPKAKVDIENAQKLLQKLKNIK
jgi:tetratricopeptide (TPR) repeat protein